MTEHSVIPYDAAMIVREAGFKKTCFARYDIFSRELQQRKYVFEQTQFHVLAPTYLQIIDWMRMEKKIWVTETHHNDEYSWNVVRSTEDDQYKEEGKRMKFIDAFNLALKLLKNNK